MKMLMLGVEAEVDSFLIHSTPSYARPTPTPTPTVLTYSSIFCYSQILPTFLLCVRSRLWEKMFEFYIAGSEFQYTYARERKQA